MKLYKIGERTIAPGAPFESDDGAKHPANWAECWGNEDFARWGITVEVVPDPEPQPVVVRPLIPKSVIVDRLYAVGKLEAAKAALDAADLYTRERWNNRTSIYADDPTAAALLQSIDADPKTILAAE